MLIEVEYAEIPRSAPIEGSKADFHLIALGSNGSFLRRGLEVTSVVFDPTSYTIQTERFDTGNGEDAYLSLTVFEDGTSLGFIKS